MVGGLEETGIIDPELGFKQSHNEPEALRKTRARLVQRSRFFQRQTVAEEP